MASTISNLLGLASGSLVAKFRQPRANVRAIVPKGRWILCSGMNFFPVEDTREGFMDNAGPELGWFKRYLEYCLSLVVLGVKVRTGSNRIRMVGLHCTKEGHRWKQQSSPLSLRLSVICFIWKERQAGTFYLKPSWGLHAALRGQHFLCLSICFSLAHSHPLAHSFPVSTWLQIAFITITTDALETFNALLLLGGYQFSRLGLEDVHGPDLYILHNFHQRIVLLQPTIPDPGARASHAQSHTQIRVLCIDQFWCARSFWLRVAVRRRWGLRGAVSR